MHRAYVLADIATAVVTQRTDNEEPVNRIQSSILLGGVTALIAANVASVLFIACGGQARICSDLSGPQLQFALSNAVRSNMLLYAVQLLIAQALWISKVMLTAIIAKRDEPRDGFLSSCVSVGVWTSTGSSQVRQSSSPLWQTGDLGLSGFRLLGGYLTLPETRS